MAAFNYITMPLLIVWRAQDHLKAINQNLHILYVVGYRAVKQILVAVLHYLLLYYPKEDSYATQISIQQFF